MPSVFVPVAEIARTPKSRGGGAPVGVQQGGAGQGASAVCRENAGAEPTFPAGLRKSPEPAFRPAGSSPAQPTSAAIVSNQFFTLVRQVGAVSSRSPNYARAPLFAGLTPAIGRSARFGLAAVVWGRFSPPAVAAALDVPWSRSLRVRPAPHCTAFGGPASFRASAGCLAPRPARRVEQPRLARTQLAESSFYEKRNADQCLATRGMPHRHR